MVCQLWYESEPNGLTIEPADGSTWLPAPLAKIDIALMNIATTVYNKKRSMIINWCSLYDLLVLDQLMIHPAFS